jgi:rod shape-determining protein MreB
LRGGVIADFDAAEAMLRFWIKAIHQGSGWFPKIPRPRVVVGIPSGVTEVERRAVQDAALSAGARAAFLIEEPMASAIGAGIPVTEPSGRLIVDIGGGTTEIAIISLGGIVLNKSLRTAGEEMTNVIVSFARSKYGLVIGESTAEEMKIQIGSAVPIDEETKQNPLIYVARGRHLETGLPKSVKFTSVEVREAMAHILQQIIFAISETIEETPPELDIVKHGLTMTGGGSKLRGLTKLVADAIKMPVWLADHPEETVVRGCGIVLEKPELLNRVKVVGGLR